MTTAILKKELRSTIKESVREAFEQELMNFRAFCLPSVSSKEQKDIEKRYGKPARKMAKRLSVEL
jgi:hypothetical protein